MKRCPECRRDYYDDTLLYCLDDGNALLEGPANRSEPGAVATGLPADEPPTAILHETDSPSEAPTRAQIHTTAAEPQSKIGEPAEKQSFSANRAAEPQEVKPLEPKFLQAKVPGIMPMIVVAALVVLAGGFFASRYLTPAKQIESIAVMPFVNESDSPELEFLSDGMTETLIKSLSEIPNLAVKSRSTVFFYKGKAASPQKIGDELGVQAVLLGRFSGRNDDLKVSLELVDTRTQDVIWTEQYEAPRSDVVRVQGTIARDVSTTLRVKLTGEEKAKVTKAPTNSPEAYQAFLKGRYYFNLRGADNLLKSIEQFNLATQLDPNYALAFSGLADSYALYSDYSGTPGTENATIARMYAERAIALDPQLAEPHATLGILNAQGRNWDAALMEGKKAVDLNPNYPTGLQWYASILLDLGRFKEAAEMMKRAHDLDPVSPAINDGLSSTYVGLEDFAAAMETSRRYIEVNPNFPGTYRNLGFYYSMMNRHAEAVTNAEKAVQIERSSYLLGDLGYVYAAAGKRSEAIAIIRELEDRYANDRSPGRYVAEIYSGLGEKENAMKWLEKDFQNKPGRLAEIRWSVPYRSMRYYPPFNDLLRRMGMPPWEPSEMSR